MPAAAQLGLWCSEIKMGNQAGCNGVRQVAQLRLRTHYGSIYRGVSTTRLAEDRSPDSGVRWEGAWVRWGEKGMGVGGGSVGVV